jgi:hypothetical protein
MAKNRIVKKPFTTNYDAIRYCFKEGYVIYPFTTDNVVYFIHMEKGHQKAALTERYTMKDIDFGINEIYNKLYDKRIK